MQRIKYRLYYYRCTLYVGTKYSRYSRPDWGYINTKENKFSSPVFYFTLYINHLFFFCFRYILMSFKCYPPSWKIRVQYYTIKSKNPSADIGIQYTYYIHIIYYMIITKKNTTTICIITQYLYKIQILTYYNKVGIKSSSKIHIKMHMYTYSYYIYRYYIQSRTEEVFYWEGRS